MSAKNKHSEKQKRKASKANGESVNASDKTAKNASPISKMKMLGIFLDKVLPEWSKKINDIHVSNEEIKANRKKDIEFNTMLMISLNGVAETLVKKSSMVTRINDMNQEISLLTTQVELLTDVVVKAGLLDETTVKDTLEKCAPACHVSGIVSMGEIFEGRERAIKEFQAEKAKEIVVRDTLSKVDVNKCYNLKLNKKCTITSEMCEDCLSLPVGGCELIDKAKELYALEVKEKEQKMQDAIDKAKAAKEAEESKKHLEEVEENKKHLELVKPEVSDASV